MRGSTPAASYRGQYRSDEEIAVSAHPNKRLRVHRFCPCCRIRPGCGLLLAAPFLLSLVDDCDVKEERSSTENYTVTSTPRALLALVAQHVPHGLATANYLA